MRVHTYQVMASRLALALMLPALPQAAHAQNSDAAAEQASDLIVVTAQRRAELSRDVPISITSINSDQLTSAGANQLSDIANVTPALRFDSAATFVQPTIRGVGTAVASSGGGANVGIYIDGFYSPNPLAADFQLMSLRGVQVLKGPQGTLFGRNTTGGAILLTTAEPTSDAHGEFRVSYGRFDSIGLQSYATFGVVENVSADVEAMFRRGDGFVHNITTGSDNDGRYRNWSLRTGLKFDFSDAVSLLLRYVHSDTNDPTLMNTNIYVGKDIGGAGTNLPSSFYATDPNEVATSGPSVFRSNNDVVQATLKADLGFADLASYTQYRDERSLIVEDLDHTAAPIFLLHIPVSSKTFSQELLLTSKPGGRLQWTAGLFYFRNRDHWGTRLGQPSAADPLASIAMGGSGTDTRSYAAFADATYTLADRLFLTVGARYSHDEVRDPYYIVPFSGVRTYVPVLKGDKVTPRAVLRFKPSEESSVYASYSKGYKAGILDVGGNTGNRVAPEDIDAYEVGFKFDDRRLSFDLSAYYYDYKNLQVSLYRGNPPSAQIINAASSEIYGLEGQLAYRLTDRFQVNLGAAYTHGRYTNFVDAPVYTRCTLPSCAAQGVSFLVIPTQLRDVPMQRTPEFTGNVGARYTLALAGGSLALSGNLYYTSKFYFGPSGTQFPQKGYEVLALRAEWTDPSDRISLAVFGDNVTNNRYRTQVQYNNFGVGNVWSAPATWGVQASTKF
ncbi:TonB-dependent receptor [Sphingobium sp. BYY-5]|uniref:TonB-dependent receptor n=1 Tax=Sphingobium sp. BYY-5 TaxID=2926400 RepID=UPI001FA74A1B|nr:TonB-dependent receptor [Sphingobium sp. BYY-5]MCI4592030.1 TonB-dependent receptor [Sphingobium sp. BYY-5]